MKTKFFRFLILQQKNTQNAAKGVYAFAPLLDFSCKWTDEKLNERFGLTEYEVNFINSLVREMD